MRGEKPVFLPVPDVPDVDDSNDFMLGLPDPHAGDNASAPDTSSVDMSATEDVDLSSIGISGIPGVSDLGASSAPSNEPVDIPPELAAILGTPTDTPSAPDAPVDMPPELASILGGPAGDSSGDEIEMPDLSDFLDEPVAPAPKSAPDVPPMPQPDVTESPVSESFAPESSEPEGFTLPGEESGAAPAQDGMDALSDLGDLSDLVTLPDASAADSIPSEPEENQSADALDVPDIFSLPEDFGKDESLEVPEGIPSMDELLPEESGDNPVAIDQAALDALFSSAPQSETASENAQEAGSSEKAETSDEFEFSGEEIDMGSETPQASSAGSDSSEPRPVSLGQDELDNLFSAPAETDETAAVQDDDFASSVADDAGAEPSAVSGEAASSDDFSLDDFSMDSLPPLEDMVLPDDSLSGNGAADTSSFDSLSDDFSMDTASSGGDSGNADAAQSGAAEVGAGTDGFGSGADGLGSGSDGLGSGTDDLSSMFDTSELDFPSGMGDDFSMGDASALGTPDASLDVPSEMFDTSEMEGLDFSQEGGGSSDSTSLPFDDNFPVTGEGGDDFELTDDFEIPGFSDTDTAPDDKKIGFRLDAPDFSKANANRPPNTLTEEEYEKFRKNLAGYPLNLRIAVEDFIVKDEFKDDVIFEVVEKVLKRVSARQLAGHLEKLLDISIDVPRDFERRSVAEYEAYKKSFQYQLKNRILPMTVAGIVLAILGFFMFQAGKRFVYQPIMASRLYNQGYTLLENNEYPQSEELFKQAVGYKAVKKWFFRYAKGYREHKQFERAAQMYRNILGVFNHDKQAGLEYARMELYERANYARAEEIVRRSVLDNYINDSAGILLLGDIFLEWAEIDSEKYELARLEYSNLVQLYGATDLYMSRMMRYFIRTDNLPNVLSLKNRFYSNKKSLGAEDWTELSGYLLDKMYGKLSKTEESLRSSIEDVRDMLETAVKLDPVSPVARYNLSRYFLHNNNDASARREMQIALDLFERAPVRTRKNTYREINGNRVLGELFARDREYIKAQESYTKGIDVYTEEHEKTGLPGDEDTGKLYADMGDLDYFITGDMDAALSHYQTAVGMKNDTPSLNYRIGAIHYTKKDYEKALGSFIKTAETKGTDSSLLLSLGNTLSLRGDNFAAQGYYSDLITRLNTERARRVIFNPHHDDDDNELLDLFVKANNNLGVTLYRLARQTGDSAKNAEALVRLSDSMRAWDAYTRNPETMKRLEGSNLASQNSKYITHPYSDFEPAIYTDIPKTLEGEAVLE